MQRTRGKMYKIRLKLTSLFRLLDACPPPEGACVGVFDADTVWLPHFSRPSPFASKPRPVWPAGQRRPSLICRAWPKLGAGFS